MGEDTDNLSLSRFVGLAEPKRGAWRIVAHKGARTAYSPDLDPERLRYVRSLQAAHDALCEFHDRAVLPIGVKPPHHMPPNPEAAFCAMFPEVMAWLAAQGIDYESAVKPFMAEMLRAG